ncbi:hypothetical protein niasHS_007748 [Heterodera schachtii]|uniref:Serpentine receptor class gamma n=1 Tax=Heterodera schachtii TaxID=97005 RepID=A0ABD2JPL4_HETSC
MGSSASAPFFSAMGVLANSNLCPFLFALAIGIPSAVLYCSLLLVIVANFKHFSSPFFILIIIRAILSLINYVVTFLALRFCKIGLFFSIYLKFPRLLLAFLYFMVYYAFHVENLLTAFLLLNRLSAIVFPMKYGNLWRVGLPFVVAFSFIFPLPFTVPIFGLDMYIHVQNDNATFTIDFHKTAKDLHSSEIAAWSAVLFGIVCLFLNVATLLAYKLRSNYQQNDQNAANERKMTIYTVSTFFGQLLMAIFMVIRYISGTNFVGEHNNRFSYVQAWFNVTLDQADTLYVANFNQYPWVNDLSTVVIPAWLLLWASSKLRQIIAKKLQFVNRLPEHTMFVRQQIKFVSPQTQPINGICR